MNDHAKHNGAADGAHDPEPPDTTPGASDPQTPAGGARFGIRRSRTRAEERIAELDTSPAKLTADLDAMRTRAESAEAELAEAKASWQRTAADFQNFKRRTEQERTETAAWAAERLLGRVLSIADDFDRAIDHAPTDPAMTAWVEGVTAIERKLRTLLDSEGVTAYDSMGQPFDPRLHEAISTEPTTEQPDGTVLREFQKGYELNGRVLRPALVAVAANASTTSTSNEDTD
jgi:molecular chaperone GrpE